MKRNICLALTVCCLTLIVNRPAQAWSKFNFGIGLNLGWEGAGNSVLWGALRGGPAPGAGTDAGYGPGPGYGKGGFDPGYGQAPPMPPAHAGGFTPGMQGMYGDASPMAMRTPPGMGMPYPMGMQMPMNVQTMPAVQPMPQMPRADAQPVGYFTYPQYSNSYVYPQYNYYGYGYYPGTWYGY